MNKSSDDMLIENISSLRKNVETSLSKMNSVLDNYNKSLKSNVNALAITSERTISTLSAKTKPKQNNINTISLKESAEIMEHHGSLSKTAINTIP